MSLFRSILLFCDGLNSYSHPSVCDLYPYSSHYLHIYVQRNMFLFCLFLSGDVSFLHFFGAGAKTILHGLCNFDLERSVLQGIYKSLEQQVIVDGMCTILALELSIFDGTCTALALEPGILHRI